MPDHFAIGLNGDPLCNQIFLDHFNQIVALDIFRGRSRRDTLWVEVWLSAELIDPLGEKVEMLLLLFRVLSELFFNRLTGEASRASGVEFIAEYANDLRRHSMVQDRDVVLNLSLIVLCEDRKSTRLNSSHEWISYAVFCLKKKNTTDVGLLNVPGLSVALAMNTLPSRSIAMSLPHVTVIFTSGLSSASMVASPLMLTIAVP